MDYFDNYVDRKFIMEHRKQDPVLYNIFGIDDKLSYTENIRRLRRINNKGLRLSAVLELSSEDYRAIHEDLQKEKFKITVYKKYKKKLNMCYVNFAKLVRCGYFSKAEFNIKDIVSWYDYLY